MMEPPEFHVVGGRAIRSLLSGRHREIVALIRESYRLHHAGRTINPDSYFLRFPDKPSSRIIALPARVQANDDVAGIKWISSFPENREIALPRASAVIILNDMNTGFPYACLEGSHISAVRTAASAALAAEILHPGKRAAAMATIGCGPIAATVVDFLMASGWEIARFRVHDVTAARAHQFSARLRDRGYEAVVSGSAADAARGAGLVLFATTAGAPHLEDSALFTPEQTVLHISLRDLGVPIILSVQNFVDDIEHCMKAQTSLHLAEQATGGRSFVDGTIGDLLAGEAAPDPNRVRVFSPFGLGVLDIAVARFVFQQAVGGGQALVVEEFFASAPCSN